ncbi:hypothetical protein DPMN_078514 [Dreissena polymorpha]|uniref:Uncharacterized protein n=1 Tax=Dreissena polymorpha TaxID=45954 RepID=A0A9D3YME0_DREPO|nr:hypothetical protein DPMN_078514 [Dreissena polymorpha]
MFKNNNNTRCQLGAKLCVSLLGILVVFTVLIDVLTWGSAGNAANHMRHYRHLLNGREIIKVSVHAEYRGFRLDLL